jgi:hypothetical protein
MDFFQYLKVLTILMILPANAYTQIESGKVGGSKISKSKKSKIKALEKPEIINPSTLIYFGGGFGSAFRNLSENNGLFGKPLGERVNETSVIVPSFTLGLKTNLKKSLFLDLGISVTGSGEQYSFKVQDSSFKYKNTYSYFAIPIKVQYMHGNKLKLIAGVGLQPQILTGSKKEISWTNTKGKPGEETLKGKEDLNFFSISAIANLGVNWQIKKNTSLFLLPEFRVDLSDTYMKQAAFDRKGFFIGGQVGISVVIN